MKNRNDEIKKLVGSRFWSEQHQCFVTITAEGINVNGETVKLMPDEEWEELRKTDDMLWNLIQESKTKYRMKKRKSRAFGKDVYLLGKNAEGYTLWLEEPKWDCGWYWGFGYIETYTNKENPAKARDRSSHSHFSGLVGNQEYYDHEKGCFRKGDYVHNVYDSPRLVETCFSSAEGWQLSELFREFYLLKDMADYTHRQPCGCHLTTSPVDQGDMSDWHKHINEVMIPKITAKILEILSPAEGEKG